MLLFSSFQNSKITSFLFWSVDSRSEIFLHNRYGVDSCTRTLFQSDPTRKKERDGLVDFRPGVDYTGLKKPLKCEAFEAREAKLHLT